MARKRPAAKKAQSFSGESKIEDEIIANQAKNQLSYLFKPSNCLNGNPYQQQKEASSIEGNANIKVSNSKTEALGYDPWSRPSIR